MTCRAATEGSEKGGGDEAVECVIVGTEAACVVSEDEDDEFDAGDAATSVARAGEDAAAADGDGAGGLLAALGGAALISPFFLWGTSMVAMKEVLPVTSPLFVASIRLVPAGLVLTVGREHWSVVAQGRDGVARHLALRGGGRHRSRDVSPRACSEPPPGSGA